MSCLVDNQNERRLTLFVHFEDGMNRHMTCTVGEDETAIDLADELVHYGLISEVNFYVWNYTKKLSQIFATKGSPVLTISGISKLI